MQLAVNRALVGTGHWTNVFAKSGLSGNAGLSQLWKNAFPSFSTATVQNAVSA